MRFSVAYISALFAIGALAACGGGSGGGIPNPGPSAGTQYSAKIIFVGQLAGRSPQIQPEIRAMDAGALAPIMLVSPITAQNNIGSQFGSTQGLLEVQVSPLPSAPPAVTFTNTDPNAAVTATPSPAPGATPAPLPSGVIAAGLIVAADTPNVQSAGIASATIGAPLDLAPTAPVYIYEAISLQCRIPQDPGSAIGWNWNGSAWAPSSTTPADVYVTCGGGGASSTLNIPGGFVTQSTDTPYSALSASQWSNAQTSLDFLTLSTLNGDGSVNAEIIGKTADGSHTFKLFPNSLAQYPAEYSGAAEVSGAGVDGY